MQPAALESLLGQQEFRESRRAADRLLRQRDLSLADKAHAFWVLSRSLAGLHEIQEALGPAELAVHYSRESRQYDLLGEGLIHLASLCCDSALHQRALSALDEYFSHFTLYTSARSLEGRAFYLVALCYDSTGNGARAVEYHRKAYRWYATHTVDPQLVDWYRAALSWQYLLVGQALPVPALLAESEAFLKRAPNDLDARARLWVNRAYLAFLRGDWRTAVAHASRTVSLRGVAPARKAQALLVLHDTAAALGCSQAALGFGAWAKVESSIAGRPDLGQQVTRAVFQSTQHDVFPATEELLEELMRVSGEGATGQCHSSVE